MPEPIIEVAEVGEFWVPESHLARLVVGAKVRVRLGECPLVGRWKEASDWNHSGCHEPDKNGVIAIISNTDWAGNCPAPGHTYEVNFPPASDVRYGHYAAAELEPVEEAADAKA